eukprot:361263_1
MVPIISSSALTYTQEIKVISFNENDGKMEWVQKHMRVDGQKLNDSLDKFFILADDILMNLKENLPSNEEFVSEQNINDENAWYWLPSDLKEDVLHLNKDE